MKVYKSQLSKPQHFKLGAWVRVIDSFFGLGVLNPLDGAVSV